jgi:Asp/Glu/hydantoin racemase
MSKTLGLIYTAPAIVDSVTKTVSELMPSVQKFDIIDNRIIPVILAEGGLTPKVHRIVANYVRTAEDEGADAVLVTCSSISPCVDTVKPLVSLPVFKIDDPMTDIAVEKASRIGVVATNAATLGPTTELLRAKAESKGKTVQVTAELCKGAFEALSRKDTATHDQLVLEGIKRTAQATDLIVLAQASMARIVPQLGDQFKVPILTSLRSGVEQVKPLLAP